MKLRQLVCWLFVTAVTGTAVAEKDPVTGRFLQRDPIQTGIPIVSDTTFHGKAPRIELHHFDGLVQYADGMNLYEFVRSNPVNFTDPLGTWTYAELGATAGIQGLLGGLFSGAISSANGGSFGQGFAGGFIGGALGGATGFLANSAFAASASGLWATFAAHSLVGASDGAVSAFGQSFYSTGDLRSALADAAWGAALGAATGGLVDLGLPRIRTWLGPQLSSLAFSRKAIEGMSRGGTIHITRSMVEGVLESGTQIPDPQGVANTFMYSMSVFRNGKEYVLDVLWNADTNTVWHVLLHGR